MYVSLFSGIALEITARLQMLHVLVQTPNSLQGQLKGLMGNYDTDPDNDFMFPNGSVLSPNTTEKGLFPFGQGCKFCILHMFYRNFILLRPCLICISLRPCEIYVSWYGFPVCERQYSYETTPHFLCWSLISHSLLFLYSLYFLFVLIFAINF